MKITKEVKTYAENLFNDQVYKARQVYEAPFKEAEEEILAKCQPIFDACLAEMRLVAKTIHADAEISVADRYNRDPDVFIRITHDNYQSPDKAKFMAELSVGESLEDLETLLSKYF